MSAAPRSISPVAAVSTAAVAAVQAVPGGAAHHPGHHPGHHLARPRLYIDARHGLGNRLRAIASAAAIAARTERELVIVWEPDAHCRARFGDLFEHRGAVIETGFAHLFALAGGRLYNYMEVEPGAQKDAPVLADEAPGMPAATQDDVYVRSAYPLVSPHRDWQAERAFLHTLAPAAEVRARMRMVDVPSRVAAHVRMASGPGYEHLPHESPACWSARGHAEITAWRARSHARHFMARLDALVAADAADTIYLAADLPTTYAAFAERYGARLRYLPRTLYDRSAEQLRDALADMLLLGRAERFLGSTWSSFTDMAIRLAPVQPAVEMSGRDF